MVRFDVFVVHQPQCQFFNWAARCSKEHTNPLTRDEARRIALISSRFLSRICFCAFNQSRHAIVKKRSGQFGFNVARDSSMPSLDGAFCGVGVAIDYLQVW